jgi:hypothetical protein
MKHLLFAPALAFVIALTGCRAHMATITLINSSSQPISTIIVDYPSATFGKDKLAPGETFSSRVKFTADGPLKIQFTDANGGNHASTGPALRQNQEGQVEIRFAQDKAMAKAELH